MDVALMVQGEHLEAVEASPKLVGAHFTSVQGRQFLIASKNTLQQLAADIIRETAATGCSCELLDAISEAFGPSEPRDAQP